MLTVVAGFVVLGEVDDVEVSDINVVADPFTILSVVDVVSVGGSNTAMHNWSNIRNA